MTDADRSREQSVPEHGVRLETERLVLRDFVPNDFEDAHAYRHDPEVARFMLTHQPESPEQTRGWLRQVIQENQGPPRGRRTLAIENRAEERVIGQISIGPDSDYPEPGEVGIGYMLARSAWGGGYATEAARAIVDFGFRVLGADLVSAWCSAANPASARVLEKAGLRLAIREESIWPKTGKIVESFKYTVGRDEWVKGCGGQ
jgi:RimJ/RimL family protein N-acetyltransferase